MNSESIKHQLICEYKELETSNARYEFIKANILKSNSFLHYIVAKFKGNINSNDLQLLRLITEFTSKFKWLHYHLDHTDLLINVNLDHENLPLFLNFFQQLPFKRLDSFNVIFENRILNLLVYALKYANKSWFIKKVKRVAPCLLNPEVPGYKEYGFEYTFLYRILLSEVCGFVIFPDSPRLKYDSILLGLNTDVSVVLEFLNKAMDFMHLLTAAGISCNKILKMHKLRDIGRFFPFELIDRLQLTHFQDLFPQGVLCLIADCSAVCKICGKNNEYLLGYFQKDRVLEIKQLYFNSENLGDYDDSYYEGLLIHLKITSGSNLNLLFSSSGTSKLRFLKHFPQINTFISLLVVEAGFRTDILFKVINILKHVRINKERDSERIFIYLYKNWLEFKSKSHAITVKIQSLLIERPRLWGKARVRVLFKLYDYAHKLAAEFKVIENPDENLNAISPNINNNSDLCSIDTSKHELLQEVIADVSVMLSMEPERFEEENIIPITVCRYKINPRLVPKTDYPYFYSFYILSKNSMSLSEANNIIQNLGNSATLAISILILKEYQDLDRLAAEIVSQRINMVSMLFHIKKILYKNIVCPRRCVFRLIMFIIESLENIDKNTGFILESLIENVNCRGRGKELFILRCIEKFNITSDFRVLMFYKILYKHFPCKERKIDRAGMHWHEFLCKLLGVGFNKKYKIRTIEIDRFNSNFNIGRNKFLSIKDFIKPSNHLLIRKWSGLLRIDTKADQRGFTNQTKSINVYLSGEGELLEQIASKSLDHYFRLIDFNNLDTFLFVIQELERYVRIPETRYKLVHFPEIKEPPDSFPGKLNYAQYIENIFIKVLCLLKLEKMFDFHNLFKYGILLNIKIREYWIFCGIFALISYEKKESLSCLKEIVSVERILISESESYLMFFNNLNSFCQQEIVNYRSLLPYAFRAEKFYLCLQLLEILNENPSNKSKEGYNAAEYNDMDLLQICYYKLDIPSNLREMHFRTPNPSATSFFFYFLLSNKPEAAKSSLTGDQQEGGLFDLNDVLQRISISFDEKRSILTEIDEIETSLCKWSDYDLVADKDQLDCRGVGNKKGTTKMMPIARRNDLNSSDNNFIFIDKNILESKRVKLKTVIRLFSRGVRNTEQLEAQYRLLSSANRLKQNKFKILEKAKLRLKVKKIRGLRREHNYELGLKEISSLLKKKHWSVYYEMSKLLYAMGKPNEAEDHIKKLIHIKGEKEKYLIVMSRLKGSTNYTKEVLGKLKQDKYLEKTWYDLSQLYYTNDMKKKSVTQRKSSLECMLEALKYSVLYFNRLFPKVLHLVCEKIEQNTVTKILRKFDILKIIGSTPKIYFYINQICSKCTHTSPNILRFIIQVLVFMFKNNPSFCTWNTLSFKSHKQNAIFFNQIFKNMDSGTINTCLTIYKFTDFLLHVLPLKPTDLKEEFSRFNETNAGLSDLFNLCTVPTGDFKLKLSRLDPEVTMMISLQAPLKIGVWGDDGRKYHFLLKGNDDCRKDTRFMEIIHLFNKSVRRSQTLPDLYGRTYNVIPINYKAGLIEWIEGLTSVKSIFNIYDTDRRVSEVFQKYKSTKKVGIKNFKIACEYVGVHLPKWFRFNFRTPRAWFIARRKYTNTYAVMCILGWFMGLGDRHTDNIMIDNTNGDTVHVDLNCLFEKAKALQIPERVPFRLTQNIIRAFGILGIEGYFRHVMELILKKLIDEKDCLITNFISFAYDPLFESKFKTTKQILCFIEEQKEKLDMKDYKESVNELIKEATDENNLARMYIGWNSFV